jgi:signal transduction histidine kinase
MTNDPPPERDPIGLENSESEEANRDGTTDELTSQIQYRLVEEARTAVRAAKARSQQLAEANEELRSVNLALSRFVPDKVLRSLGVDGAPVSASGQRAEAAGLLIERLQNALEFRERFLANVSHELRTPLNAILGITEVLREGVYGRISEKQSEMLGTVEKSGDHLLSLINSILDLSKIEAGQSELRRQSCNLERLCRSTIQLVRQQAQAKGLALHLYYRCELESVDLDARRVRQILLNLLSNALKFTESGSITVEVDLVDEAREVCLRVKDTGMGISEEDQELLFQPFFQVHHGLARKYSGTGLGLAITRRAVQLHGGRIELESRLGRGSDFTVFLPLQASPSSLPRSGGGLTETVPGAREQIASDNTGVGEARAGAGKAVEGAPVLLFVDDVEENRRHVADYFEHEGYVVCEADNGYGALRHVMEQPPDLVLLDIHMPGLSGFDLLRCMQALSVTRGLPVLLVSSEATPNAREIGMQLGAQGFVTKPFRMSELRHLVERALGLNPT